MYSDDVRIIEQAIVNASKIDCVAVKACVLFDREGLNREAICKVFYTSRPADVTAWVQRGRRLIRDFLPPKEDIL